MSVQEIAAVIEVVCFCIVIVAGVLTCLTLASGLRAMRGKPKSWWESLIRSPR